MICYGLSAFIATGRQLAPKRFHLPLIFSIKHAMDMYRPVVSRHRPLIGIRCSRERQMIDGLCNGQNAGLQRDRSTRGFSEGDDAGRCGEAGRHGRNRMFWIGQERIERSLETAIAEQ